MAIAALAEIFEIDPEARLESGRQSLPPFRMCRARDHDLAFALCRRNELVP
jgi:hypothetical protein